MSKKVKSEAASESKGLDVVKLVKKAKELYDEYGDTIISLSETLGIKDKIMSNKTVSEISGILAGQEVEEDSEEDTEVEVIEEDTEVEEIEEDCEVEEDTELVETEQEETSLDSIRSIREEVEADDSFNESLSTLSDAASVAYDGRLTNPQEVCKAIETLAAVAVDTIKYSEEQETKREEIRAKRDVAIAQINAMRDAVQTYLDKSFDERSVLFAKQFECVDAALKAGDNDMLAISLNNINALAASSPFKALADINQVQKALTSSETEWDI
jgi:hypothetical protein